MKIAVILSFASLALAAPAIPKRDAPAPLLKLAGQKVIAGKYIVKLKEGASQAALDRLLKAFPETEEHVYKNNRFKGFASALSADSLKMIQNDFDVDFVEEDGIVKLSDTSILEARAFTTQAKAGYGLARISHKASAQAGYTYDTSAGAGTCAYIVDTGIFVGHTEFGGRATWLANFAGDGSDTDGNGHGTHVAGTVGGTKFGVAKATSLFAVKVLDASGSGTNSGVIAGMNFVATDSQTRSCPNGAVANMSLGGAKSKAVNDAAAQMVSAGVFLAVAAGNDNADAADSSPASELSACTVGAITNTDARASYSNFGPIVDIFAPGSDIKSSWIGSKSASKTISGTSMATPHITGLGAYLLTLLGKKTPQELCSFIQSTAISGAITDIPSGTNNLLAFNGNPSG